MSPSMRQKSQRTSAGSYWANRSPPGGTLSSNRRRFIKRGMLENIPRVGQRESGNGQHVQPKPHDQLCGTGDSPQTHGSAGSTRLHPGQCWGGCTATASPPATHRHGRLGSPLPAREPVGISVATRAGLRLPRSRPGPSPWPHQPWRWCKSIPRGSPKDSFLPCLGMLSGALLQVPGSPARH